MSFDLSDRLKATLGDTFTIERELGGGGMSRTYIAVERALNRRVVLKVLSPELSAGVSIDRFHREIQIAATLQHPHLVPVLSTGEVDGLPWFAMPYVDGQSLRARLAGGPMSILDATAVLRDVARALEFAHGRGVVHRDIKPDNILLSGSSATVTDFGIAKALSEARDRAPGGALTLTGMSVGTPMYMAPEQAVGDPSLDHRSDIYSFGIVAYELLAGRPPFDGVTAVKLVNAHLNEIPRDVREMRPDTPPALAELVMRCLAKDPDARPQAVSEIVRSLESVPKSDAEPQLAAPTKLVRAVAAWGVATVLVVLAAWVATSTIGLPDWVLPGAMIVMAAGLPAIVATWYVQRAVRRVRATTATTAAITSAQVQAQHGTLALMAVRASPHVSWRRTALGGAVAVGGFALLVAGFMILRAFGIGPAGSLIGAGKFGKEERIIITDFKSPAKDSTLGITVTEALRADLAGSSVLRVVPRATVDDALRVSQRPTTTRVDFPFARQIATAEGVKAVLDGEVMSLGVRYKVVARLVSATSGTELASFSVEANDANDLIPAIGRLGKQLRAKVGESLRAVHDASSLEKVTTSSMSALSKYLEALTTVDRTGDQARAVSLLEEAVAIDSMFAMAWRRLAAHHNNLGQLDLARARVTRAYQLRNNLAGVERYLTEAAYFTYGPESDQERALDAYESALAIDSMNVVALANAAEIITMRREHDRAAKYRRRAISRGGGRPNAILWSGLVGDLANAGRIAEVDSVARVWEELAPNHPTRLLFEARIAAFAHVNLRQGDSLYRELLKVAPDSRSVAEYALAELGTVSFARGRLRDGFQQRTETARRQAARGDRLGLVRAGLDSVLFVALVLEQPDAARSLLQRVQRLVVLDSIPLIDRPYFDLLMTATFVGDSTLARRSRADYQRWLEARGKVIFRPADEALTDGFTELAAGRNERAIAKFAEADRLLEPWLEICALGRFLAFDRMGQRDSAIVSGEAYLAVTPRFNESFLLHTALFRPNVLQRLGELYEAKAMPDSAITKYQSLLEFWKDADPELQPRLRDVRARVDRLRASSKRG